MSFDFMAPHTFDWPHCARREKSIVFGKPAAPRRCVQLISFESYNSGTHELFNDFFFVFIFFTFRCFTFTIITIIYKNEILCHAIKNEYQFIHLRTMKTT